jgi:PAS domain S-box-containing protein
MTFRDQDRYRLLFDSNPIPAWVYDIQSLEILDVNSAAIRHYGYSREEFLALTIKDIRPGEDVPAVLKSVANANNQVEHHGIWRHRKKDGTIIDVEVTSHPLIYEDRETRLVVAADITERKSAEAALRISEERFRLMVSNVKDYAILMLDPEGHVISWNEGAERLKGYRAEEIIGQHFSRFYVAEDIQSGKPAMELEEAAKHGWFEDVGGWRIRKDGSRFWANVVVTALRDEQNRLRGFGKVTRDITERKRSEEEIARRNAELEAANKELEAFSYSVSHDLRAPLRGIDGFSQALLEDYGSQLDAAGRDYLQRVREATKRMGLLIDDLLDLSRVTRAEMHRESIDLSQMATTIASELHSNQPERKVDFVVAPRLQAEGDMRLMRVVLENLIGNSWKFTSRRESGCIEVGRTDANGHSAFFVRDNGAGFDPTHASKLFGAFQRLHAMSEFPGTGIGLATVQRIIHRHGGKVWAEGAVGKGATVYFTL